MLWCLDVRCLVCRGSGMIGVEVIRCWSRWWWSCGRVRAWVPVILVCRLLRFVLRVLGRGMWMVEYGMLVLLR